MPSSTLLSELYDYLIARQNEYTAVRREIFAKTDEMYCRWDPRPEMHQPIQALLPLHIPFVEFVRKKLNEFKGDLPVVRRYLLGSLCYEKGGKPLIASTPRLWDVRPVIVDRMLSYVWYETMQQDGYRILTEKVAAALHSKCTAVFVKRYSQYIDRRESNDVGEIRIAVKLECPEQTIINSQPKIIYQLDACSKKRIELKILPWAPSDHDLDHMWLFKPARRSRQL